MHRHRTLVATLCLCALAATGCGGGSGDGGDASAPAPNGDVAIDAGSPGPTAPPGADAGTPIGAVVNGFVAVARTDTAGDGALLLRSTSEVDAAGGTTIERIERFGEGEADVIGTLEHDAAGRLTAERYVEDAEGGDGFSESFVHEHDAAGRLLRSTYTNDAGDLEITSFGYGADGELLERTVSGAAEGDAEAPTLSRATYEYGADALPVSGRTLDYDAATGEVVRVRGERYEHDGAGRLVGLVIDDGDDGTDDGRNTYAYDRAGNMVRLERFDVAGGLVETEAYEYAPVDSPVYNTWLRIFRYFL